MQFLQSALRIIIVVALLALLIPLFFYVGIAALGVAVVGGIASWFAASRMKPATVRTQRWTRRDNGIIIDHE